MNEGLRGTECVLPQHLHAELFGGIHSSGNGEEKQFIGLAPWTPSSNNAVEENSWTVLPVKRNHSQPRDGSVLRPDTIHISANSTALPSILKHLESNPFGRQQKSRERGFEVHVVEVQPLELEKIYISVDGDALRKHEEVQRQFGGGFLGTQMNGSAVKTKKAVKAGKQKQNEGIDSSAIADAIDDELTAAVRRALESATVARQGDPLLLPLPAHPITHVPFPPAHVVLCEPVAQGLPTKKSQIVVNRIYKSSPHRLAPDHGPLPILSSSKSLTDFDITDGDGTSNEAYHSAVEDGDTSDQAPDGTTPDPEERESSSEDSSDDSSDDMITMSTPAIATRHSVSTNATATPTLGARSLKGLGTAADGIRTPGSIFSNMTSMTARHDYLSRGRVFKANVLPQQIFSEILYPSPLPDDDDECRVFVDMKVLVRLGCFSGDWVKLGAVIQDRRLALGVSPLAQDQSFRPARIFGLTDLQSPTQPRNKGSKSQTRRSSVMSTSGLGIGAGALSAWFPPSLLANLSHPGSVRISPLFDDSPELSAPRSRHGPKKVETSSAPPIAREMTLLRVSTPLSTERSVQNGLFVSLKRYFEQKSRIVKQGDTIAVPVDAKTSRLFGQPSATPQRDDDLEELLTDSSDKPTTDQVEVAYFKVGTIAGPEPLEASDLQPSLWGGALSVDPSQTRMRQSGTVQSKIPSSKSLLRYLTNSHSISPGSVFQSLISTRPQEQIPPVQRRLRELLAAATSPRALHLKLDPVIILLHSSQRNIGKTTLATRAASDLGVHTFRIDAYDVLSEGNGAGDVKAEALLQARIDRARSCGPAFTTILLTHVEALTADRMISAIREAVKDIRVLIATTTELDQVPENLRSLFTHEIEVSAPDEGEREGILRDIIRSQEVRVASDVDVGSIAVKTAALVAGNLVDVVERAKIARKQRLDGMAKSDEGSTVRDVLISGGEAVRQVTKGDFEVAVEAARKNFADSIGAPKIPNVSWADVGGLEHVKDAVLETIQLPLERPELFAKGMKKRSGILFYGPPGTGKTLLAKAIATEFSLNFFSVKGPELLNMYIGESEANVRRVFQRARDARPCVVFFDELDSVAPKRGNQGDSGGVMDRIVSQLLAELDGMSDSQDGAGGVFVIGATNRPDLLDPALLRPGRFDKMLYLGVSDTHDKQLTILEALTRKFAVHPDLSLRSVVESLPFTYTGADMYALASDAMLKAITRQAGAVDKKIAALPGGPVSTAYFFDHLAREEDIAVMVTEEDFAAAQRELVPSVR